MNQTAIQYAVKLLSKRDYSQFKLTQKLKSKGYQELEIDTVISILVQKKILKEEVYTEDRAISLIRRNYGNRYIHRKLEEELLTISDEKLDILREEYNRTETDVILDVIEKKTYLLRKESKLKQLNKINMYLISRGFDISEVQSHLNQLEVDVFID
jgi:regulatory protein